jgi:hypothetical protein
LFFFFPAFLSDAAKGVRKGVRSTEPVADWIGQVDPLTCPKACPEPVEGCPGIMRITSFIEDRQVIKAILKHHPPFPGMLAFSRKKKSRESPLRRPPYKPKILGQHFLDTQWFSLYIQPTQKRVLFNFQYSTQLASDPLSGPNTALEMRKLGLKESEVEKVVWNNPNRISGLD